MEQIWKVNIGNGPLVAAAIHDGHSLRPELTGLIALDEDSRLREEDPFTGEWTQIAETQIVGTNSRFEVDLNRPREKAVYELPQDAWGLKVWKNRLSPEIISASLAEYDAFYSEVYQLLKRLESDYGRFVVLDLHTYNHHREGADSAYDDPEKNPEINIGTGTMNREHWAPIVDRFMSDLRNYNFRGRSLDVRENVKFKGGQFSRWIHQNFPESACCIAVEFKKFFMDEWSGKPDIKQLKEIRLVLQSTVPGILETLRKL